MFDIQEELKKLPEEPGVYLMKNEDGDIIYVGKAISLKNRVRQYFRQSKNHAAKVIAMVKNIVEFEYIITDNEVEALILESNLIKKHKPKYNILLRDDKNYPYIKVTLKEKFPRVMKTRKVIKDGSRYFGPYVSTGAVNDTLDIIDNLYKLRTCRMNLEDGPSIKRPCLNFFINKCMGPCFKEVDHKEYLKQIDEVLLFLSGKEHKLIEIIEDKMKTSSLEHDFESAAKYRDQVISLNHILEKQKIVSTDLTDQDVIGMARGIENVCIQVFFIRTGKVIGREHFIIADKESSERGEILGAFIKQFYMGTSYIPKEILIEEDIEDIELVSKWLSSKRGNKVSIKVPKRGEKNDLMEMVRKNAIEVLSQHRDRINKSVEDSKKPLQELKQAMNLEQLPLRIEAFDISNIQGVHSVASMVVFEDGKPNYREYRKFKIKWVHGPDDYSSMEEVIRRRFMRGLEEQKQMMDNKIKVENFSVFPDLIMMDGGKGQVNVAKRVLSELEIDIPVCGLVKDDSHRTRGILYEGEEIRLPVRSSGFKLITRIQDEAHRFAITYHKSLRSKDLVKSVLDEIPGIGDTRKKNLLRELKTIDGIKSSSVEELAGVSGMNKRVAQDVYEFFNK